MDIGNNADVIVIGAGGGGCVVAKELGDKGVKVLLFEAGPWYGNKKWPDPNTDRGGLSSSGYSDLSIDLLKQSFTDLEDDMNNQVSGKFRWGPANRELPPWQRLGGQAWQVAGVGGTTLHYFGNSPRAFPSAIDSNWPIPYSELVPYYEKAEALLPVNQGPVTAKEELFYYGAKRAGWSYLEGKDVTGPGYRQNPNAILKVNPSLMKPDFDLKNNRSVGCTLRGHCVNGCHIGPSIEAVAKRSTLVSYIPRALASGNVEVRPNTFVTEILTETDSTGELHATGVRTRDTWTGETGEYRAKVIVMSAGGIETPRLWLNSGLPANPWVGRGLSSHWFDSVLGIFDEKDIMDIIGVSDIKPFVGQNSAARFDYPGLGAIIMVGISPGLYSSAFYGASRRGEAVMTTGTQAPWDYEGALTGALLKEIMRDYNRTISLTLFTDDAVDQRNGITLDAVLKDENGFLPIIHYQPSEEDMEKREKLAVVAAELLKAAGARTVIRTDWPPDIMIHIMSTMRIGYVTDTNCEAFQVKRLFIADNSVLYNGLGGPNPTLTTQALAIRTSEKIHSLYFQ